MSAKARRKSRNAGEKQGHRREVGRTPQSEVRELREIDPWDVPEQPWERVLDRDDLD